MKRQIQQAASFLLKVLSLPPRPTVREALKAHDTTEKYWLDSHSPLFPWLTSHGIHAQPGHLPEYAQGGVGRVYFVDPQHAVKFSANRVEANVAQMVKGNSKTPTAIIDVTYLGDGIYAILQPYVNMKNIPGEIKQAADYLMAFVDEHPEMQDFPADPTQRERLCRQTLVDNGGNLSLLPHMVALMGLLSDLYQATGFRHDDAGPTNVGIHGNRIVFPDLGPNEPAGFNALGALSQINKNRASLGLPRHRSF